MPFVCRAKGIWFAQQLAGELPITIAQYVEVFGELDIDLLEATSRVAAREFGSGFLRLVDHDGELYQLVDDSSDDGLRRIDFARRTTRGSPRSSGCAGSSAPR